MTILESVGLSIGLGGLPDEADVLIRPELRKIVAQNLSCDITLRNFRAPRLFCLWKQKWFAGSIALSDDKIIAFRWKRRLINTRFDDPRFTGLQFSVEDDTLSIAHDASLFRSDWSGSIEHRFRTPDAAVIASFVQQRVSDVSSASRRG